MKMDIVFLGNTMAYKMNLPRKCCGRPFESKSTTYCLYFFCSQRIYITPMLDHFIFNEYSPLLCCRKVAYVQKEIEFSASLFCESSNIVINYRIPLTLMDYNRESCSWHSLLCQQMSL